LPCFAHGPNKEKKRDGLTVCVSRMYLKGTWQMRILRVRTAPGTHLGQERLGGPFAGMGRVSPLR